MALTVLDVLPEAADLDVRILATDIDPNMVAEGAAGIYSDELLSPVPASGRKHFTPVPGSPGQFSADATLRRLVSFRELNLIGDWPMKGRFDVIFCRNVVIYFDDATQEILLFERLGEQRRARQRSGAAFGILEIGRGHVLRDDPGIDRPAVRRRDANVEPAAGRRDSVHVAQLAQHVRADTGAAVA